jgi:hypothetical protein
MMVRVLEKRGARTDEMYDQYSVYLIVKDCHYEKRTCYVWGI